MANALAIAAVSAVLKDLLNNGLIDASLNNEVTVRVGPPPASGNSGSVPQNLQLNLFLYQVTPNLNWRNECLPSHNSRGNRINNAPLALDLRYLLTAYGNDEFDAEVLLGYAMQLMHEHTILSRGAIRRSLSGGAVDSDILPGNYQTLAAAGLAEQMELIKITAEYLDTESMSRLWSSLQATYRTSTAYHVSVVLIEREESTQVAPPVLNRRVFALPVQSPVIETIEPQLAGAGATITLKGQGLKGNPTQVVFGNREIAPIPVDPTNERVDVALPAGLRAGVMTIQVLHPFDLETPNEPHRGVDSNVAAFMLQPAIQQTAAGLPPNYALDWLVNEAAFNAAFPTAEARSRFTKAGRFPAVRLDVIPTVVGNQRITLLLNETPAPADRSARAYSFSAPALLIDAGDIPAGGTAPELSPENQRSEVLVFFTPGISPGNYLVRVRVDGADSPLMRGPLIDPDNPSDPVAPFTGPTLTVGGSP